MSKQNNYNESNEKFISRIDIMGINQMKKGKFIRKQGERSRKKPCTVYKPRENYVKTKDKGKTFLPISHFIFCT